MNDWKLNNEEVEFLVLMYKWYTYREEYDAEPDMWFLKINGWSHSQHERVFNSITMKLSL